MLSLRRTRWPTSTRCSRRARRYSGSCNSRYASSPPCCTRLMRESPATFSSKAEAPSSSLRMAPESLKLSVWSKSLARRYCLTSPEVSVTRSSLERGVMLMSFGQSKRRATEAEHRRIRTFPSQLRCSRASRRFSGRRPCPRREQGPGRARHLAEARDDLIGEESHRVEGPLVGNLPARVHPRREAREAEGIAEFDKAIHIRLGNFGARVHSYHLGVHDHSP